MTQLLRSFCTMLGLLSRGDFAKKLDEEMKVVLDTLDAMPNQSGKAKITVEVEFIAELGRLDIKVVHKVKLPETSRFMKTPFWMIEGALSSQHPSQTDMFAGPRPVAPVIDATAN
ncbi:MAG: uncharacterized protein JWM58_558 [Rhizobium sp.]|nr:uncharacterized protein [Rhizobium sp.]